MKTIVVTGSEGFIGRNLIKLLLKNGYKIISIDEIKRKRKNKFNCTQLNSIKSFFNKKKNLKKIVGVVHFAALSRDSMSFSDPIKLFQKNLIDTLIILQAIRYSKKKPWFIFSSTKQIEIDKKNKFQNLYSITKESCEKIIKSYAVNFGIKSTILRFTDVYGTTDNSKGKVLVKLIDILKNNKKFTIKDPAHKLSYIHVDDISRNILHLIKNKFKNTYREINLYGKKTYNLKSMTFLIKKMVSSKSKVFIDKPKKNKQKLHFKLEKAPINFKKDFKKELSYIVQNFNIKKKSFK